MNCFNISSSYLRKGYELKSFQPILSAQQQKVLIAAVIAFNFLGTCYIIYRCFLKENFFTKIDKLNHTDVQKDQAVSKKVKAIQLVSDKIDDKLREVEIPKDEAIPMELKASQPVSKQIEDTLRKAEVPKDEVIPKEFEVDQPVNHEIEDIGEKTKNDLVNEKTSLKTLGCNTAGEAIDYIISNNLSCANLSEFPDVTDDDVKKLSEHCPNPHHLFIKSDKISNKALEHLKGMPLTSVDFNCCFNLTDQALEHLKGMPLTSI